MRNLLTASEARAVFDAALAEAGTLEKLARRCDVSTSYVCDVRAGKRRLTGKLARALGLQPRIMFERIAPCACGGTGRVVQGFVSLPCSFCGGTGAR